MLLEYTGKIIDGKPMINEPIDLPDNTKIIIIIMQEDSETSALPDVIPDTIKKRREMVRALRGILPPDIDIDALKNERIAKRGLL